MIDLALPAHGSPWLSPAHHALTSCGCPGGRRRRRPGSRCVRQRQPPAAGTPDAGTLSLALRAPAAAGSRRAVGPVAHHRSARRSGPAAEGAGAAHPRPRGHGDRRVDCQRTRRAAARARPVHPRRLARARPSRCRPARSREVRFAAGHAGTYHYWATTLGAPVPFRELAGAFIVDPPGADPGADRVLVITEWSSLTRRDSARSSRPTTPARRSSPDSRAWPSWSTAWAGRPPSG